MKDSIKAGELRLGNWVMYDGWHPDNQVKGIEQKPYPAKIVSIEWWEEKGMHVLEGEDGLSRAYTSNFAPIPLSKEVLEKCGFVPSKIGHYIDIENTKTRLRRLFVKSDGGKYWLTYADILLEWKDDRDRITLTYDLKNLHTLQNWYNLLSGGKELEITL